MTQTNIQILDEVEAALNKIACLGNGNEPGNSDGNVLAQAALAKIPALREGIGELEAKAQSAMSILADIQNGNRLRAIVEGERQRLDEYTAFQNALKEYGSPDDEFGQYHCDSGNLYALWGRAVEWATKQSPEQNTRLRAIVEGEK